MMKGYPAYKDSGFGWLGEIPSHWKTLRVKYLFREVDEKSKDGEETLLSVSQYTGVTIRGAGNNSRESESLEGYKVCYPDDFVSNIMLAWMGAFGVTSHHGIVSPAYCVYRLKGDHNPKYFDYLFHTPRYLAEFARNSTGIISSRWRLYTDDFFRIFSVLPPREEQDAIVAFLEEQTAVINQFLTNKRRLIALLEEQKQVVINTAVTQGLDTAVSCKPSGIDWLGDIPAHWKSKPIKRATAILRGKFSHRPRNDPRMYDGKYPFIQTGNIESNKKYITEYHQTLSEEGYAVSKEFPKGTLVMTITGSNTGNVAILDFVACFPDSIVGFVPAKDVDLDFLYYLFTAMKEELILTAPVNTQPNLNIEKIGALHAPFPSKAEQRRIVQYIEQKIAEINAAIERTQREIELIEEYRTTLIGTAVTGKIDVQTN